MTEQASNLVVGTVFLTVGVFTLQNLDTIARFDQSTGRKLHSWVKKNLGGSTLSRDIFSVGTPSGLRNSKIGLGGAGVLFMVVGLLFISLGLLRYFHLMLSE
jgi:hypothetical protein